LEIGEQVGVRRWRTWGTQIRSCATKIFQWDFFSTLGARKAVPFLQRVFQADACHMSFGKYTLYSCYVTTANCNTYSVAFGILFGNEDKEGWMEFWDFAKSTHPSIDDTRVLLTKLRG
jgi:hypothetical protein